MTTWKLSNGQPANKTKSLTLSNRHDSRHRMQEDLKEPKAIPPLEAISPNAAHADFLVAQSLFLSASCMLVIAVDKTL